MRMGLMRAKEPSDSAIEGRNRTNRSMRKRLPFKRPRPIISGEKSLVAKRPRNYCSHGTHPILFSTKMIASPYKSPNPMTPTPSAPLNVENQMSCSNESSQNLAASKPSPSLATAEKYEEATSLSTKILPSHDSFLYKRQANKLMQKRSGKIFMPFKKPRPISKENACLGEAGRGQHSSSIVGRTANKLMLNPAPRLILRENTSMCHDGKKRGLSSIDGKDGDEQVRSTLSQNVESIPSDKHIQLLNVLRHSVLQLHYGARLSSKGKIHGEDAGYVGSNGRMFHGIAAQDRKRYESLNNQIGSDDGCFSPQNLFQKVLVIKAVSDYYSRFTKINCLIRWQVDCLLCAKSNNSKHSPTAYVIDGKANLICQAPTGSGKTLISEILIIRALLRSQEPPDPLSGKKGRLVIDTPVFPLHFSKKCLFVVPYRVLVEKTTNHLKRVWEQPTNKLIRVEGFFGNQTTASGKCSRMTIFQAFLSTKVDVIVCTTEIGAGLIEQLSSAPTNPISRLGIIVIDEAEILDLGNHRGQGMLNALAIVKQEAPSTQIVAMSATFLNGQAERLQSWLDASLFVEHKRVQPIRENIIYQNGETFNLKTLSLLPNGERQVITHDSRNLFTLLDSVPSTTDVSAGGNDKNKGLPRTDTSEVDVSFTGPTKCQGRASALSPCLLQKRPSSSCNPIVLMLQKFASKGKQTIIFCNTKNEVRDLARLISKSLRPTKSQSLRTKFRELLQKACKSGEVGGVDIQLLSKAAVGIHKADLTSKTRLIMERAFKDGVIDVLVATTTIARGVNFPADCVILHGATSFYRKSRLISMEDYLQKIGRAGRMEFKENGGESYVLVKSKTECEHAEKLVLRKVEPQPVTSVTGTENVYLCDGGPFHRFLIVSLVSILKLRKRPAWFGELLKNVQSTFWHEMFYAEFAKNEHPSLDSVLLDAKHAIAENFESALMKLRALKMVQFGYAQSLEHKRTLQMDHSKALRNWARLADKLRNQPHNWQLRPTRLALAVARSALPIKSSIELSDWLNNGVSVFSIVGRLALIVPVYTTVGLTWPSPGPYGKKCLRTWHQIQLSYEKLSDEDQLAMQNLGYNVLVVDSILDFQRHSNHVLEMYRRIQCVLILIDLMHKLEPNIICRRWQNVDHCKLDDFRREAIKMCVKVRKFCKELNLSECASLFNRSLQKRLQLGQRKDQKNGSVEAMDMEFAFRNALRLDGFATPESLAKAQVKDIAIALERRLPDNLTRSFTNSQMESRAEEIRNKARRHLKRLSIHALQDSSSECDEESDLDLDQ